jgi:processive 1,2-diacylglycerol beta-glucosyltransferase
VKPLRITICTASVGHGHTKAAEAIEQAVRRLEPSASVTIVDAIATAPSWFVRVYRDAYLGLISGLPAVAGWMYETADVVRSGSARGGIASTLERRAMRSFLAAPAVAEADLLICTHFLCARVISDAKARGELRAPMTVCVTDQHPHGVWMVPHADRIMVASEDAMTIAVSRGVPSARLMATGIPVEERFSRLPTRRQARLVMGLPEDRPIILVCGGGLGLGSLEEAVRAFLNQDAIIPVHVVAVCGRNESLRRRLESLEAPASGAVRSCTVLGYTEDMPILMAASDIMVGKPGGLTTAEAATARLPMVLLKPIPGQEERNAARLVSLGAAVLERDARSAVTVAADIATSPSRVDRMRAGAAAFAGCDEAGELKDRGGAALARASLALVREASTLVEHATGRLAG